MRKNYRLRFTFNKKGEIHVMGPNGSGKSTLANAIMGNPIFSVDGKILLKERDNKTCSGRTRRAWDFPCIPEPA